MLLCTTELPTFCELIPLYLSPIMPNPLVEPRSPRVPMTRQQAAREAILRDRDSALVASSRTTSRTRRKSTGPEAGRVVDHPAGQRSEVQPESEQHSSGVSHSPQPAAQNTWTRNRGIRFNASSSHAPPIRPAQSNQTWTPGKRVYFSNVSDAANDRDPLSLQNRLILFTACTFRDLFHSLLLTSCGPMFWFEVRLVLRIALLMVGLCGYGLS